MNVNGLTEREQRLYPALVQHATAHEAVALRLARMMALDGVRDGALWIVRKLIARRWPTQ